MLYTPHFTGMALLSSGLLIGALVLVLLHADLAEESPGEAFWPVSSSFFTSAGRRESFSLAMSQTFITSSGVEHLGSKVSDNKASKSFVLCRFCDSRAKPKVVANALLLVKTSAQPRLNCNSWNSSLS